MQTILPIIIGTLVTIITSIILLPICLKYRAKKILELTLSLKNSLRLSAKAALVFVIIFQILNITGTYIGWIMYSLWALIGMFSWVFLMQVILKKELMRESLDFDRANKLARSSASYFFWIIILIWVLILAAQTYSTTKMIMGSTHTETTQLETEQIVGLWKKTDWLFEKKEKCNEIFKELSSKAESWETIAEVFYSSKLDSCIAYKQLKYWYRLIDALTGEYIIWVDSTEQNDEALLDSLHRFRNKLLELKWQ